jgi:hypothetical protein
MVETSSGLFWCAKNPLRAQQGEIGIDKARNGPDDVIGGLRHGTRWTSGGLQEEARHC